MTTKVRLLIADDQPSVRQGLGMFLELEPDIEVVGEAGDGREAVDLASSLLPDVVLMDARMPAMDGFAATAALRREMSECAVVVLSLYDDPETRARALSAGAAAFVPKHRVKDALLATVRRLASEQEEVQS